jgi:hypothetical protein
MAASELERALANWSHADTGQRIELREVNRIYAAVCETPQSDFGHYFRNLYHITKYVDESSVSDKRRYTSQVRAQFSQAEFALLMANGLRREGKSKFKPLIERYALLHESRLTDELILLKPFYGDGAFGTPER